MSSGTAIEIQQGATWRTQYDYGDVDDSGNFTPISLTGWTLRGHVKRTRVLADPPLATIVLALSSTAGRIDASLSDEVTATLEPGTYYYDIKLISPSGDAVRLVQGPVIVDAGVTA